MCTLCYLAGNFLGAFVLVAPEIYFVVAFISAIVTLRHRSNISFMLTFLMAGAASVQIYRIPAIINPSHITIWAAGIKTRCSNYIDMIIPASEERAIVKALAIGDKSDISRSVMSNYKASGAVHLLALSGLHVGVIYKILTTALKPLGGHLFVSIAKSIVIIVTMWCFAIISGLSPSISRAVIMITFYELSNYFHSDRDGLTILSSSALFIMLVNPEAPREIGFQLSFMAMLSIYLIFPKLKQILSTRSVILRYTWNTLALSISCQMTTGVLSYFYFGTFPRFFMITNLISMPLITIIMYLTAASLAFANIPEIGEILVVSLQKSIHLMSEIMSIIGGL